MRDAFDQACERLEGHLPRPICRALRWVRGPSAKWFRIPIAILCFAGSFFWFLPVLGIWMLPVALLLLADDVPFLRRPVGRLMNWMMDRWEALRARLSRAKR